MAKEWGVGTRLGDPGEAPAVQTEDTKVRSLDSKQKQWEIMEKDLFFSIGKISQQ